MKQIYVSQSMFTDGGVIKEVNEVVVQSQSNKSKASISKTTKIEL